MLYSFDSWYNNWENLSSYFKYPSDIRRIIYTTNIIESVHRQFRTLTKTKGAFPNDNSLLKLLYAGIRNAEKKWTMPIRNWSLTILQLNINFKERLKGALDLRYTQTDKLGTDTEFITVPLVLLCNHNP